MNGRKARAARAALRERNEQLLVRIRSAEPVRVRTDGDDEVWESGPATLVVPVVCHDYPTELRDVLVSYRAAILTGVCPDCTIEEKVTEAGHLFTRHEAACRADADQIAALAERLGVEFNRGI
ncbi:hypothetical protein ACIRO1_17245 [Streptomyces sp. NPDC102381]|uniref:hypothetical protein n=1 Tax=Streptomyces sp. NPDC102381 TaxID=3366164 RepID=UPI00381E9C81